MPLVMLTKGQAYYDKRLETQFEYHVPKSVDDEAIAHDLVQRGKFVFVNPTSEADLVKLDPTRTPKNVFGDDDLDGKRILLKRLGGIGDTMFVVNIAQYLKSKYPQCYIGLATTESLVEFGGLFDCIDETMTLNRANRVDIVNAFEYIVHFNGTLDTEYDNRPDQTDYLKAHWDRAGFADEMPEVFPRVQVNRLAHRPSLLDQADELLNQHGVGQEPYVVVLLNTSHLLKTLHPERAKEIAEGIAEGQNRTRVLILSQGRGRKVYSDHPWVSTVHFDSTEELPLACELVRKSKGVIAPDTGLLHYGASIGVPTIALFGPTDHKLTLPHYDNNWTAFQANQLGVDCSPCRILREARCDRFHGGYTDCMKSFTYNALKTDIDEMLGMPPHEALELKSELVIERNRPHKTGTAKVAVLLDNAGSYTGGGFYTWQIAKLLARNGVLDVHVLTDKPPVYAKDDDPITNGLTLDAGAITYEEGRLVTPSLEGYDVVVGNPPETGCVSTDWFREDKGGRANICLVYETPTYIKRYRTGRDSEDAYWQRYKRALLQAKYVWCISSVVRDSMFEWDERFEQKRKSIDVVSPPINSDVADQVLAEKTERQNMVVLIGRNMAYKRLAEGIDAATKACGALEGNWQIAVLGQNTDKLQDQMPKPPDNVEVFCLGEIREKAKWELLAQAKAVICPSDFEGFGIVVPEALYAKVPVLCQPLEVYKDCFKDYPIYYKSREDLGQMLTGILLRADEDKKLKQRIKDGRTYVARRYTLKTAGARTKSLFANRKALRELTDEAVKGARDRKRKIEMLSMRVAMVTTWGSKCGIAETTKDFVDKFKCACRVFAAKERPADWLFDDTRAVRCWERDFTHVETLRNELLAFKPDIIHIQHEFSFFKREARLFALIDDFRKLGIPVVVTLHTYSPSNFVDELAKHVDRIIVTKEQPDVDYGKFAAIDLPVRPPHRTSAAEARAKGPFGQLEVAADTLVVGGFGMWNSHKGFRELLRTRGDVALRAGDKTVYTILGHADARNAYAKEVSREFEKERASHLYIPQVEFVKEMQEVVDRLSVCNILVCNYNVLQYYSASAAIRTCMSVGRPVICTESPMFSEFEDGKHVLKVPFGNHQKLVEAILRLWEDKDLRKQLVKNCDDYLQSCTAEKIAEQYEKLYKQVIEESTLAVPAKPNEDGNVTDAKMDSGT